MDNIRDHDFIPLTQFHKSVVYQENFMLTISTHAQVASRSQVFSAPADIPLEYLAFSVGDAEYGVDIQKVQELRGYDTVTRLANSPAFIKGVVNLRGVIVPIIDMRIQFGVPAPSYNAFTVVIILQVSGRLLGVVVDKVSDVITMSPEQIKPVPAMGGSCQTQYLIGLATLGQSMLTLIDIAYLMSSADFGLVEAMAA